MIAIVNVDPNPRPGGVHLYELRINHEVICAFYHDRDEPLHTCLEKAAAASKIQRDELLKSMLDIAFGEGG